jgi:hypothetical protein
MARDHDAFSESGLSATAFCESHDLAYRTFIRWPHKLAKSMEAQSRRLHLVGVLQRVSRHPARNVAALTPRCWKARFAANPLRSDVMGAAVHG